MKIQTILAAPLVLLALGSITACGDGSRATATATERPQTQPARVTCLSGGQLFFDDYVNIQYYSDGAIKYFDKSGRSMRVGGDCLTEFGVTAPEGWSPILPGRAPSEPAT